MAVNVNSDQLLSLHERNTQLLTQIKAFKSAPGDISGIVRTLSDLQRELSSVASRVGPQDQHIQILNMSLAQTQAKVLKLQTRFPAPIHVQAPMTSEQLIADRAQKQGYISFYDDQTDPLTGCFGNFHICPKAIEFGGKNYSNSEAIFQSRKFTDNPGLFNQFTAPTDGDTSVKLGQSTMSSTMLAQWDNIKEDAMMNALRAKFGQNPTLKAKLMATGNVYLVEHLPSPRRDTYWSDAYDGTGKNRLGICLMKLRQEYGGSGEVPKAQNYLLMLQGLSSAPANIPAAVPQSLCNRCHVRPKYFDQATSRVHDYCSRTCAQAGPSAPAPASLCNRCHLKPKFVETSGRVHDYCGKACARADGKVV